MMQLVERRVRKELREASNRTHAEGSCSARLYIGLAPQTTGVHPVPRDAPDRQAVEMALQQPLVRVRMLFVVLAQQILAVIVAVRSAHDDMNVLTIRHAGLHADAASSPATDDRTRSGSRDCEYGSRRLRHRLRRRSMRSTCRRVLRDFLHPHMRVTFLHVVDDTAGSDREVASSALQSMTGQGRPHSQAPDCP